MKKTLVLNIVLFAASLILLLCLTELAFRLYTNVVTVYDVEMHKYAMKVKHHSKVPGLSHEHRPNSHARLMGVDVVINSMGLRDNELTSKKSPVEYRVLVLGSSITFGWGVPFDSVFTQRLERLMDTDTTSRTVTVINAGVGNYNTKNEAALLDHIGPVVEPDLVVVHYFINDAEHVSPDNAGWLVKNSYAWALLYVRLKQAIHAKKNQYSSLGEYYTDLYREDARGWQEAQDAILQVKSHCVAAGYDMLLMIQPDLHDLAIESPLRGCHKTIREFLEVHSINYLDLIEPFHEEFGGLPREIWVAPDDSHPNSRGHKVIAQQLERVIWPRMSGSGQASANAVDSSLAVSSQ